MSEFTVYIKKKIPMDSLISSTSIALVKHIWMEHWILKEISIMDYNDQKITFLKK